ncbi:hypothetical protein TRAPUB_2134 [Trametes pubescens]|uniref:Uncharacterized protein n=1 Tax=Trametes pubescens TaxID=154538 RepID=A0A1M2VHC5_TRAPU|nr:hypothetical protein TRAPUB_2134 [Trametes pubescens]
MPPLKRRREGDAHECDIPEDPAASAPSQADDAHAGVDSRDGEFWLEDGSIILVLCCTAFRVYRHLLEGQAFIDIVNDLVASADSSTGQSFEGCPLVHLPRA